MFSQPDADVYMFEVDWFDSNANLVKNFVLKYFSDGQIEMNNTDGSKFETLP